MGDSISSSAARKSSTKPGQSIIVEDQHENVDFADSKRAYSGGKQKDDLNDRDDNGEVTLDLRGDQADYKLVEKRTVTKN